MVYVIGNREVTSQCSRKGKTLWCEDVNISPYRKQKVLKKNVSLCCLLQFVQRKKNAVGTWDFKKQKLRLMHPKGNRPASLAYLWLIQKKVFCLLKYIFVTRCFCVEVIKYSPAYVWEAKCWLGTMSSQQKHSCYMKCGTMWPAGGAANTHAYTKTHTISNQHLVLRAKSNFYACIFNLVRRRFSWKVAETDASF